MCIDYSKGTRVKIVGYNPRVDGCLGTIEQGANESSNLVRVKLDNSVYLTLANGEIDDSREFNSLLLYPREIQRFDAE